MKLLFVLVASFLVAQAAVLEEHQKISVQDAQMIQSLPIEFQEYEISEYQSTTWCLIKLAWKIKQTGINGVGGLGELGADIVSTSYGLARHALKCRRLKKEANNIWGNIAYQACRASLAAQGTYEIFRLRREIKEATENDFWLVSILGLRRCLKSEAEVLENMDYVQLNKFIDTMNKY
uniref:CSON001892 protein n=1 Tax=Culicoides sonorensis TaxID=179676 RepID=A0A336KZ35_CULSO